MAFSYTKALTALQKLSEVHDIETLLQKLNPTETPDVVRSGFPSRDLLNLHAMDARVEFLEENTGAKLDLLARNKPIDDLNVLEGNIENYIGMSRVPTGVIGPIKVIGSAADGDFFVPLATSEGALIASYHRGAKATFLAGGVRSVCLTQGVQRAPLFRFKNLGELGTFLLWLLPLEDKFREIVSQTSRYAQLDDLSTNIEGNQLTLLFNYITGDASGQNMVTICTDAICQWIIQNCPVQPECWYVEGNFSGDKKATAQSFLNVRGKKVTAETELPKEVIEGVLKTSADKIAQYCQSSTLGTIQSGSIGAQGHYANGLAALFIATGQDAACVSEAAVGITRMEARKDGSLYAAVTLPNLIVGTVGGGTALPTQRECLELMDCYGPDKARKFAEIAAAMVLAGELSIASALSAGHFTSAHERLGRKK
ncbi:hydroxymethylglutaryl-CoA reductase [Sanyastnella coralliicola]|uniref:hydroxymethylglutaryl-CoA reductase n=1 Tax=Sanyastnella coralliicola TaxID=3069118 RepID=UPI0027B8FE06|nr:hydroxymethylglutaryl-CoA reductase [Longitalea sp. SCSIO 12813]